MCVGGEGRSQRGPRRYQGWAWGPGMRGEWTRQQWGSAAQLYQARESCPACPAAEQICVGKFRQKRFIEARKTLKGLLEVGQGERGEPLAVAQRAPLHGTSRRCAPGCGLGTSCCRPCPCGGTRHLAPVRFKAGIRDEPFRASCRCSADYAVHCAAPQAHPEFRQAESLLEACDKEILKDGLVGLGAGAAIVGGIAAIAIAAMRR